MTFWRGLVTDPETGDASSTRLSGVACIAAGILWAFAFYDSPNVHKVISAFIAGGGVALLLRSSINRKGFWQRDLDDESEGGDVTVDNIEHAVITRREDEPGGEL